MLRCAASAAYTPHHHLLGEFKITITAPSLTQALQGIQLLRSAAAVQHLSERSGRGMEAARVAREEKEAAEAEAWGAHGEHAQEGQEAVQKQPAGGRLCPVCSVCDLGEPWECSSRSTGGPGGCAKAASRWLFQFVQSVIWVKLGQYHTFSEQQCSAVAWILWAQLQRM